MMFGAPGVVNDATKPLTIDRMRLEPVPDGLEALATYAAGIRRRDRPARDWDSQRVYPRLNEAAGYVVEPGGRECRQDTPLLFVLRPTRPGTFRTKTAVIDHHVGDQRYRRTLGNGLRVCAPPKSEPDACERDGR